MLPLIPYGGSVLGMIISLKNNARQRKKAFEALKAEKKKIHRTSEVPEYRKISPQKLSSLKTKIVKDIEKENNRHFLKGSIVIILISVIIFYGLTSYFKYMEKKNIRITKERQEIARKQIDGVIYDPKRLDFFLADGQKWLVEKKYKNAKAQYLAALQIDSLNYAANFGYTSAFVYDCIENNMDCTVAEQLLNQLHMSYKETEQIATLNKIFHSKK